MPVRISLEGPDQVAIRLHIPGIAGLVQRCGGTDPGAAVSRTLTQRDGRDTSGANSDIPKELFKGQFGDLTPSEVHFCILRAHGLAEKDIAQVLDVSVETVRSHRSHAWGKLGVTGRANEFQARYGVRYRMVSLDRVRTDHSKG